MDSKQFDQHVTILGWLYIVLNAIGLVIGGLVFVLLAGIGIVSGDMEALGVLGLVGTFVAFLMAVLALPGLLAGYGLLRRAFWGRILAIILGILSLPNFPLGTALGIYALFVLFQEGATEYFAAR